MGVVHREVVRIHIRVESWGVTRMGWDGDGKMETLQCGEIWVAGHEQKWEESPDGYCRTKFLSEVAEIFEESEKFETGT